MNERDVAFHEAGHAVLSVVTRSPVKSATIVPDGETLGHVQNCGISKAIEEDLKAGVWKSTTKRSLFRTMMVLQAGMLAATRVCAHSSRKAVKTGSQADLEGVVDCAFKGWGPDCAEKIDQSKKEADRLLSQNWKAVEAVAGALLEEKTLSGKRVREIVMENGGIHYLVRGAQETVECFKRNASGALVKYRPQIGDFDNIVVRHEAPITVEPWQKPTKPNRRLKDRITSREINKAIRAVINTGGKCTVDLEWEPQAQVCKAKIDQPPRNETTRERKINKKTKPLKLTEEERYGLFGRRK